MTEREFAIDVVFKLQAAGFVALFAGGCVRDELLGITPADHDIATSATPDDVKKLFRRTHSFGASFGVVEVIGPRDAGGEWLKVQVATFRSDGTYTDGRRPDAVTFSSPEEDAARRDFTLNGLFLDPLSNRVLDFVNGRADLEAKVLRAIGDPVLRFAEDKLRILRAVRMAARFELTVDPATHAAATAMAGDIAAVSAERIAEELRKILTDRHRVRGLELLDEFGLFPHVLPEVTEVKTRIRVAGDRLLGPPTIPSAVAGQELPPSFPLVFAVLMGNVTPKVAGNVCRRLRLSNDELERIVWLVANRSALVAAPTMKNSVLFPILAYPGTGELIALHEAEAVAAGDDLTAVEFCLNLLRTRTPEQLNPKPLLTGDDLQAMGLSPGPRFKKLLDAVRVAQLDGEIANHQDAAALVHRLNTEPEPNR